MPGTRGIALAFPLHSGVGAGTATEEDNEDMSCDSTTSGLVDAQNVKATVGPPLTKEQEEAEQKLKELEEAELKPKRSLAETAKTEEGDVKKVENKESATSTPQKKVEPAKEGDAKKAMGPSSESILRVADPVQSSTSTMGRPRTVVSFETCKGPPTSVILFGSEYSSPSVIHITKECTCYQNEHHPGTCQKCFPELLHDEHAGAQMPAHVNVVTTHVPGIWERQQHHFEEIPLHVSHGEHRRQAAEVSTINETQEDRKSEPAILVMKDYNRQAKIHVVQEGYKGQPTQVNLVQEKLHHVDKKPLLLVHEEHRRYEPMRVVQEDRHKTMHVVDEDGQSYDPARVTKLERHAYDSVLGVSEEEHIYEPELRLYEDRHAFDGVPEKRQAYEPVRGACEARHPYEPLCLAEREDNQPVSAKILQESCLQRDPRLVQEGHYQFHSRSATLDDGYRCDPSPAITAQQERQHYDPERVAFKDRWYNHGRMSDEELRLLEDLEFFPKLSNTVVRHAWSESSAATCMYDEEAGDEGFRTDHKCSRETFINRPVQTRSDSCVFWETPPPLSQPPQMPINPSRPLLLGMHPEMQLDGSDKAYSEELARVRFWYDTFYGGGSSHSSDIPERPYYGSLPVFDSKVSPMTAVAPDAWGPYSREYERYLSILTEWNYEEELLRKMCSGHVAGSRSLQPEPAEYHSSTETISGDEATPVHIVTSRNSLRREKSDIVAPLSPSSSRSTRNGKRTACDVSLSLIECEEVARQHGTSLSEGNRTRYDETDAPPIFKEHEAWRGLEPRLHPSFSSFPRHCSSSRGATLCRAGCSKPRVGRPDLADQSAKSRLRVMYPHLSQLKTGVRKDFIVYILVFMVALASIFVAIGVFSKL